MNESMVDRVARALALADLDDETREVVDLGAHMAHVRGHYEDLARTAIEAMRTPTHEMRLAAWKLLDDNAKIGNLQPGKIAGDGMPDAILSVMMNVALNEKEPQE